MFNQTLNRSIACCVATVIAVAFLVVPALAQNKSFSWIPPNALPGECYSKVFIPPQYRTVTEKRLLKEASERVEVVPAQYEWVKEQVMVEPASEVLEVIPAQYELVPEKVVVKEASSRMETIPAKYEWVEDRVLVKPAETVWKQGRGPIEKIDHATGDIFCLVEIPAAYKTIKKRVMVEPPKTVKVDIPAEYGSYNQKVLVSPATVKKTVIPAVYKPMKVRRMVSPPNERRIEIPAEYQTVTRTEKVSEGRFEWARILCETNTSADYIRRVQSALQAAGYDPGRIDGDLGRQTQAAVNAYQRDNGLAVGALTYETVEKLGVLPQ